jgi:hypothetical protein
MEQAKAGRRGEANPFHGRRHTPEAREAIGRANRGRRRTPEAREAIAASKRGVPRAPEVRARISASVRLSLEAKRAVASP